MSMKINQELLIFIQNIMRIHLFEMGAQPTWSKMHLEYYCFLRTDRAMVDKEQHYFLLL